jgi:MFS family permease
MAVGLVFASMVGALLAIASNAWGWSSGTIFWAGMAMAAFFGFVVTPLIAIPISIRRENGKLRLHVPSNRAPR